MLVMDLNEGYDRLECRMAWQQRAVEAAAVALPVATVNLLIGGLSPWGWIAAFSFMFAVWFTFNTAFRTFTVDSVGIHTRLRTIAWHEVQDIRVTGWFSNRRACRVRTYFSDGRYSTEATLLSTAWWYPDPDFDARVRLLLQSWQRHLARLPASPTTPPPAPSIQA